MVPGGAGSTKDCIQMHVFSKADAPISPRTVLQISMSSEY
jgi:hypothetical protein